MIEICYYQYLKPNIGTFQDRRMHDCVTKIHIIHLNRINYFILGSDFLSNESVTFI